MCPRNKEVPRLKTDASLVWSQIVGRWDGGWQGDYRGGRLENKAEKGVSKDDYRARKGIQSRTPNTSFSHKLSFLSK